MCFKTMDFGTFEQPNIPLTISELRGMDGETVWLVVKNKLDSFVMCVLVEADYESVLFVNTVGMKIKYTDDEELEEDGVTVYRRKPEDESA